MTIGPEYSSNPVAGSTLNFGDQPINSASSPKIIEVSNLGDEILYLACQLTGAQVGHFSIETCPTPVGPAVTVDLSVRCAPSATGAKTATLAVTTNDADEGEVSYTLACSGVLPPSEDLISTDGFEAR